MNTWDGCNIFMAIYHFVDYLKLGILLLLRMDYRVRNVSVSRYGSGIILCVCACVLVCACVALARSLSLSWFCMHVLVLSLERTVVYIHTLIFHISISFSFLSYLMCCIFFKHISCLTCSKRWLFLGRKGMGRIPFNLSSQCC